ncbi:MAG: hypothetical protein WCA79_02070 [Anaerolineales bacterium]
MNAIRASIRITDETYSRFSEDEVHVRVEMNKKEDLDADFKLFQKFLE